jgi:hypothetical protein
VTCCLRERPIARARQVLIKMDRKYASGIRVGKKVTDELQIMSVIFENC